ncbi:TerB family tellurite resistance protein [Stutzerimonas stutzeri]|uniref:tellurite resistance TerB family protein n=1 Tax=Stutzerimonas stutzeri TaxID=316 RepID=UPI00210A8AD3|nr:TerB family tellurite resistance protein [Stutzerimonas stutzeri]MCQ4322269.1 TerB family tellurite resistance protein [Stutzerimonas stutzeri]
MLKTLKALFDRSEDNNYTLPGIEVAAAALLIEVGRADYESEPEEQKAIIEAIRQSSGLDDTELASLVAAAQESAERSTSLYEFTSLINAHYSMADRVVLIEALWRVAAADGDIHKYEDHLIRRIAELLYVPHSEFIRTKLKVLGS